MELPIIFFVVQIFRSTASSVSSFPSSVQHTCLLFYFPTTSRFIFSPCGNIWRDLQVLQYFILPVQLFIHVISTWVQRPLICTLPVQSCCHELPALQEFTLHPDCVAMQPFSFSSETNFHPHIIQDNNFLHTCQLHWIHANTARFHLHFGSANFIHSISRHYQYTLMLMKFAILFSFFTLTFYPATGNI